MLRLKAVRRPHAQHVCRTAAPIVAHVRVSLEAERGRGAARSTTREKPAVVNVPRSEKLCPKTWGFAAQVGLSGAMTCRAEP